MAGDWKTLVQPTDPEKRTSLAGVFIDGPHIYLTHIRVRQSPQVGILPSKILKLVPSNQVQGPIKLSGEALMHAKNCRACHVFAGRGGLQGPNLDELVPRLSQQLDDKKFLAELAKLEDYDEEDKHKEMSEIRSDFIDQKGFIEDRMTKWISAKIEHPQFSDPNSLMPPLQLNKDEISEMTRYLLATEMSIGEGVPWYEELRRRIESEPENAGIVVLIFGSVVGFFVGRWRTKKKLSASPTKAA